MRRLDGGRCPSLPFEARLASATKSSQESVDLIRVKLDGFLDVPPDARAVAQVLEQDLALSMVVLGDNHFDAPVLFFFGSKGNPRNELWF